MAGSLSPGSSYSSRSHGGLGQHDQSSVYDLIGVVQTHHDRVPCWPSAGLASCRPFRVMKTGGAPLKVESPLTDVADAGDIERDGSGRRPTILVNPGDSHHAWVVAAPAKNLHPRVNRLD